MQSEYDINKATGCWEWAGKRNSYNYGILYLGGKKVGAHRYFYGLHKGIIPKKMFVLHKCDNPPCVNPEHLFLGTQRDNMQDMAQKGRSCKFENNHSAKLNKKLVTEIRKKYKRQSRIINQRTLAVEYGVSKGTVQKILTHKIWLF